VSFHISLAPFFPEKLLKDHWGTPLCMPLAECQQSCKTLLKLKLGRKFGIYGSSEIQCAVAPRTFSWIAGKLISSP
jgi:hypothetical protein